MSVAKAYAERRERKRKHDREAQRISRERTKTRMKELEDLIETLQAANAQPERVSDLLAQIQSAREENTRLQERMRKAAELLGLDGSLKNSERDCSLDDDHLFPFCQNFSMPMTGHDALHFDDSVMQTTPHKTIATLNTERDLSVFSTHFFDPLPDFYLTRPNNGQKMDAATPNILPTHTLGELRSTDLGKDVDIPKSDPVNDIAVAILVNQNLDGRFWFLAATVLDYILNITEGMLTPRALDDDIIIRSCIEGWVMVERRYWLDSGWRWLRLLDEHMYSHLTIPNRMAIMRLMRMQYLVWILGILIKS